METNHLIIALVLIAAAFVLFILIRKNRKDQKEFEQKMNQESIDPEHHKEEKFELTAKEQIQADSFKIEQIISAWELIPAFQPNSCYVYMLN